MTCGRAGRYLFELEVTDDFAASSTCEVHVDACTCNNDLHVELVWDTPGDPDPNDSGAGAGANLDLHLLRGDGDWFCRPDDTWALNLSPDWGQLCRTGAHLVQRTYEDLGVLGHLCKRRHWVGGRAGEQVHAGVA